AIEDVASEDLVDHDRNPAQDRKLSPGQIKKLKKAGFDVELEKLQSRGSRLDLFSDRHGNLYIKPKSGEGPGEPLNVNIKKLPSAQE
ncbi:MAG: polymorphic toxin type 33 domain-containing protein, partial [Acidobacteriota bacterium]